MPTSPSESPERSALSLPCLEILIDCLSRSTFDLCREFKIRHAPLVDDKTMARDISRWVEDYLLELVRGRLLASAPVEMLEEADHTAVILWIHRYENLLDDKLEEESEHLNRNHY